MAPADDAPHFRRRSRAGKRLSLSFRRADRASPRRVTAQTENIGLGGAFVQTETPPAVGTRLTIFLTAATAWEPLEIQAEVRWVRLERPAGMGVRFVELSAGQLGALHDLLVLAGYGEESRAR